VYFLLRKRVSAVLSNKDKSTLHLLPHKKTEAVCLSGWTVSDAKIQLTKAAAFISSALKIGNES